MAADSVRSLIESESAGRVFSSAFRKFPTQATVANLWFDLSMSPGNPSPNYYIGSPGIFVPLARSTDGGIPHAGVVGQDTQYLRTFGIFAGNAVSGAVLLCDYLGFYPFIDESATGYTPLTRNVPVPRFPGGEGVMLSPIVVAGQAGGTVFRVYYTNSDGVEGRVTPDHLMTAQQLVNGTVLTSGTGIALNAGPFMSLMAGDTGVRDVVGVEIDGVGDIGLFALALIKPLIQTCMVGNAAPVEVDCFTDQASMPIIEDDAYLNLLICPTATIAGGFIHGYIKTIWT